MSPRDAIFWIIRIIGWSLAIGAILAKYNNYAGSFSYIYEPTALKFYLMTAFSFELLFINNRLMQKNASLRK